MYKISIITVCYNSERTIEETIKSIISQKTNEVEYIIIDGKSSDCTMNIIKEYSQYIDVIISEQDEGIADAFNKGINVARGKYIGIINSDDMLLPWAIEQLLEEVKYDTDVFFGQGIRLFPDGKAKRYKVKNEVATLYEQMPLCHPATFVSKEAYERWGRFNLDYRYVMDRELLLRFLDSGAKFQYSKKYYAVYRMGGLSDSKYISGVLPEMYQLNVQYGMNRLKAINKYLCAIIEFVALYIRNKCKLDNKRMDYVVLVDEIKDMQ